jgi:hypothetical protein
MAGVLWMVPLPGWLSGRGAPPQSYGGDLLHPVRRPAGTRVHTAATMA